MDAGGATASNVAAAAAVPKPTSLGHHPSGGMGMMGGKPPGNVLGPSDEQQFRNEKYGGLAKKSAPHMLLNRRKPQKNYFDSGDYNMARQLGAGGVGAAGRGAGGIKSRPPLSTMMIGTMAPTPEAVELTRHPHHEQSKLVQGGNEGTTPTGAGPSTGILANKTQTSASNNQCQVPSSVVPGVVRGHATQSQSQLQQPMQTGPLSPSSASTSSVPMTPESVNMENIGSPGAEDADRTLTAINTSNDVSMEDSTSTTTSSHKISDLTTS